MSNDQGATIAPAKPMRRVVTRLGAWVDRDEARRRLRSASVIVISADNENSGRIFLALGYVGCKVRLVQRSALAFEMLAELQPSICLVDADAADRDASGLLAGLRASSITKHALIVSLIANESRSRRRRMVLAGFDGVMCKPIDGHLFGQELVRAVPCLADDVWTPGAPR